MKRKKKRELQSSSNGACPSGELLAALEKDEPILRESAAILRGHAILELFARLPGLFDDLLKQVDRHYKSNGRIPIIKKASNGSDVHAFDFFLRFYMALSARQQL